MTESRADFYQQHLDRVSRSFAFCIQQLPEPLRGWVALSYLLCRVVDTIEDAPWASEASQFHAFTLFDKSLAVAGGENAIKEWFADFPEDIAEGEKLLLKDTATLLQDFHRLPRSVNAAISEIVTSMSKGMQHFSRSRAEGTLRLSTLREVNQYCFFVAGVVGELLTKLIAEVDPKFQPSQINFLRAHHFGQFLQKVNLLKDQVGDEKSGRHLIPSRQLVESSSQQNALKAFDFIVDLPKEQIEFRRFCSWSLFLGLEALNVARGSVEAGRVLKVPRQETENLIERVEEALNDDQKLRHIFDDMVHKLGWREESVAGKTKSPEFPQWLLSLYHGPLEPGSLSDLGL